MKRQAIPAWLAAGLLFFFSCPEIGAQTQTVIPQRGQSFEQQQRDESECHTAAMQQSGREPAASAPARREPRDQQGGAGVWAFGGRGAGAAAGAAAGAQAAREESRREQAKQGAGRQQQEEYLSARSACLQGRGYLVQ